MGSSLKEYVLGKLYVSVNGDASDMFVFVMALLAMLLAAMFAGFCTGRLLRIIIRSYRNSEKSV